MVTAAVPRLPNVLCTQLDKHGGQMILPVGDEHLQELKLRHAPRPNVSHRAHCCAAASFRSIGRLWLRYSDINSRPSIISDVDLRLLRGACAGGLEPWRFMEDKRSKDFNLDLIQTWCSGRACCTMRRPDRQSYAAVYWIEAKRRAGDYPASEQRMPASGELKLTLVETVDAHLGSG